MGNARTDLFRRQARPDIPEGRYLIAGVGRAGLAAARALAARTTASDVIAWDGHSTERTLARAEELRQLGVSAHLGGDGIDLLDASPRPRLLVKSPGLPLAAPIIRAAHERGLVVFDEAELGWRLDPRPFVGVTGTNGKGTVVALACGILRAAGHNPLVAGNTHFGPPISGAATLEGDVTVAELSSFQLEACPELLPQAAILTNLTHDHLYRHGSVEEYGHCKRRLFLRANAAVDTAVIGIDQEFGRSLGQELKELGCRVVSFGAHPDADRRVLDLQWTAKGSRVSITEGRGTRSINVRLRGSHNAANVAAALAFADALEINADLASRAIAGVGPLPGRFELLDSTANFDVVVDFAHNPDGIRRVLEASREMIAQRGSGSLRVVLSCLTLVGDLQAREMGRVAAELSDHLVLTCQRSLPTDPYDELPPGLREGAMAVGDAAIRVECDRATAISVALADATPGDVVLILGRGEAQTMLDENDRRTPFDDRVHARACLEQLLASSAGS